MIRYTVVTTGSLLGVESNIPNLRPV